MNRLAPLLVLASAVLLDAAPAFACPVCQGGAPAVQDNTSAFIATTVLLSILPLFAIGGMITWIAAQARQGRDADADLASRIGRQTDEFAERAAGGS